MLEESRLIYLFVYVSDLARSRDFYENRLGLRVLEEDEYCAKYDTGEIILALNPAGLHGVETEGAVDRSSLVVFHVSDLDATRLAFESQGMRFSGPTERYDIGATATFADPDGHNLCLYQPSAEAMTWPSADKIREILDASTSPKVVAESGPNGSSDDSLAYSKLVYLFHFVNDAPRAREFYEKQLGLRVVEEDPAAGVAKYDAGGILLAIHHVNGDPRTATTPDDLIGPRTISPVFSVENIAESVQLLESRGVEFPGGIVSRDIGETAIFQDPAGHVFYLYQASPEALGWPSGAKIRALLGTLV